MHSVFKYMYSGQGGDLVGNSFATQVTQPELKSPESMLCKSQTRLHTSVIPVFQG